MDKADKVVLSAVVTAVVSFGAFSFFPTCGKPKPEPPKPAVSGGNELMAYDGLPSTSVRLWIDPDTGCEYLYASSAYVLQPRMASDGMTHRGCSNAASPVWTSPKQ